MFKIQYNYKPDRVGVDYANVGRITLHCLPNRLLLLGLNIGIRLQIGV